MIVSDMFAGRSIDCQYNFDDSSEVNGTLELLGDGQRTYTYDVDVAHEREDGTTESYARRVEESGALWAIRKQNRIVKIVKSSKTYNYKYDYLGRRVEKSGTGLNTTRYIYNSWNLIADVARKRGDGKTEGRTRRVEKPGARWAVTKQTLTNGTVMKKYIWGNDISGRAQGAGGIGGLLHIWDWSTAQEYYPVYDATHNITALLQGSNSAVVAAYDYDCYGNVVGSYGSYANANPFRSATKYTDQETQLVYYGMRYYNPETGRFINRDPSGEEGGLNLYAFVLNNPANMHDFLGLNPDGFEAGPQGDMKDIDHSAAQVVDAKNKEENTDNTEEIDEDPYTTLLNEAAYNIAKVRNGVEEPTAEHVYTEKTILDNAATTQREETQSEQELESEIDGILGRAVDGVLSVEDSKALMNLAASDARGAELSRLRLLRNHGPLGNRDRTGIPFDFAFRPAARGIRFSVEDQLNGGVLNLSGTSFSHFIPRRYFARIGVSEGKGILGVFERSPLNGNIVSNLRHLRHDSTNFKRFAHLYGDLAPQNYLPFMLRMADRFPRSILLGGLGGIPYALQLK